MRELPSLVKGAGLRTLSLRGSWVQIPPPALEFLSNEINRFSSHKFAMHDALSINKV